MKRILVVAILAVLFAIVVSAFTNVFVEPSSANIFVGDNIAVVMNISTNASIYAIEGKVYFNNSILNANSVSEGNFLKQGSQTFAVIGVNNSLGTIIFGITRLGNTSGVSGNGSLLIINFTAIKKGNSSILLKDVKVIDENIQEILGISVSNGSINIIENTTNSPPIITSYFPLNNPLIKKWQIQKFNITKHDADGDSLSVRWYLDNFFTGIMADFYNYNASVLGNHNISVFVSDNKTNTSREWLVVVYENLTNNPPVIDSYFPLNNPVILENQSQFFNITKFHPEGKPMTVKWYLDILFTGITTDSYTYNSDYNSAGIHNITVIVSDTQGKSTAKEWLLDVRNANRIPSMPSSVILLPTTAYKNTTLTCTASGSIDADNDNISYYYEFGKGIILQNYSMNNLFNCLTNANCNVADNIVCYAKAYDSKNFSGEKASNSVVILNNETGVLGNLNVVSSPSNASIYVDNSYRGLTPQTLSLSIGSHNLFLEKEGYYNYSTNLNVSSGINGISVNLIAIPPNQTCIDFDNGKNYFIKGTTCQGSGCNTDSCNTNRQLKEYFCLNNNRAFENYNCSIGYECNDGRCVLINNPNQTGSFNVITNPANAKIYISGTYAGETPMTLILNIGSHNLLLEKERYYNYSTTLNVSSGISGISVNLRKIPKPSEINIISPIENILYNTKSVLLNITLDEKIKNLDYKLNKKGWVNLCPNCDKYIKKLSFDEGQNNLSIKAVTFNNLISYSNLSFYVDSIKPVIHNSLPNNYGNGSFAVQYTEANLRKIELRYGINQTNLNASINLTNCKSGVKEWCYSSIDLSPYNSGEIYYKFELRDDFFSVNSSQQKILVDVLKPIVNIYNPINTTLYIDRNGNIYINISVNEKVKLEYKDNSIKWASLCTSCTSYKGYNKFSFGQHNVSFRASDSAGNIEENTLNFILRSS